MATANAVIRALDNRLCCARYQALGGRLGSHTKRMWFPNISHMEKPRARRCVILTIAVLERILFLARDTTTRVGALVRGLKAIEAVRCAATRRRATYAFAGMQFSLACRQAGFDATSCACCPSLVIDLSLRRACCPSTVRPEAQVRTTQKQWGILTDGRCPDSVLQVQRCWARKTWSVVLCELSAIASWCLAESHGKFQVCSASSPLISSVFDANLLYDLLSSARVRLFQTSLSGNLATIALISNEIRLLIDIHCSYVQTGRSDSGAEIIGADDFSFGAFVAGRVFETESRQHLSCVLNRISKLSNHSLERSLLDLRCSNAKYFSPCVIDWKLLSRHIKLTSIECSEEISRQSSQMEALRSAIHNRSELCVLALSIRIKVAAAYFQQVLVLESTHEQTSRFTMSLILGSGKGFVRRGARLAQVQPRIFMTGYGGLIFRRHANIRLYMLVFEQDTSTLKSSGTNIDLEVCLACSSIKRAEFNLAEESKPVATILQLPGLIQQLWNYEAYESSRTGDSDSTSHNGK